MFFIINLSIFSTKRMTDSQVKTPLQQAVGSYFTVFRSPKTDDKPYRREAGWKLAGFRYGKLFFKKPGFEKLVHLPSFWAANWNKMDVSNDLRTYIHDNPLILNEPITLDDGTVISGACKYDGCCTSWYHMVSSFYSQAYPMDIPWVLAEYGNELKTNYRFNNWLQNLQDNFVFLQTDWDKDDEIANAVKTYLDGIENNDELNSLV